MVSRRRPLAGRARVSDDRRRAPAPLRAARAGPRADRAVADDARGEAALRDRLQAERVGVLQLVPVAQVPRGAQLRGVPGVGRRADAVDLLLQELMAREHAVARRQLALGPAFVER